MYYEMSDPHVKKQKRMIDKDLQRVVKEGQFNVLETKYDCTSKQSEDENMTARVETVSPSVAEKMMPGSATKVEPGIAFSPGLTKTGKFFTVVSQKKRESPSRDKIKERQKQLDE